MDTQPQQQEMTEEQIAMMRIQKIRDYHLKVYRRNFDTNPDFVLLRRERAREYYRKKQEKKRAEMMEKGIPYVEKRGRKRMVVIDV